MRILRIMAIALAALVAAPVIAQDTMAKRDRSLIWKYRKLHPCPSTGKVYGACRGWQVDHIIALRCGGPDSIDNMQWLRIPEHRAKTKREARECRGGKRRIAR